MDNNPQAAAILQTFAGLSPTQLAALAGILTQLSSSQNAPPATGENGGSSMMSGTSLQTGGALAVPPTTGQPLALATAPPVNKSSTINPIQTASLANSGRQGDNPNVQNPTAEDAPGGVAAYTKPDASSCSPAPRISVRPVVPGKAIREASLIDAEAIPSPTIDRHLKFDKSGMTATYQALVNLVIPQPDPAQPWSEDMDIQPASQHSPGPSSDSEMLTDSANDSSDFDAIDETDHTYPQPGNKDPDDDDLGMESDDSDLVDLHGPSAAAMVEPDLPEGFKLALTMPEKLHKAVEAKMDAALVLDEDTGVLMFHPPTWTGPFCGPLMTKMRIEGVGGEEKMKELLLAERLHFLKLSQACQEAVGSAYHGSAAFDRDVRVFMISRMPNYVTFPPNSSARSQVMESLLGALIKRFADLNPDHPSRKLSGPSRTAFLKKLRDWMSKACGRVTGFMRAPGDGQVKFGNPPRSIQRQQDEWFAGVSGPIRAYHLYAKHQPGVEDKVNEIKREQISAFKEDNPEADDERLRQLDLKFLCAARKQIFSELSEEEQNEWKIRAQNYKSDSPLLQADIDAAAVRYASSQLWSTAKKSNAHFFMFGCNKENDFVHVTLGEFGHSHDHSFSGQEEELVRTMTDAYKRFCALRYEIELSKVVTEEVAPDGALDEYTPLYSDEVYNGFVAKPPLHPNSTWKEYEKCVSASFEFSYGKKLDWNRLVNHASDYYEISRMPVDPKFPGLNHPLELAPGHGMLHARLKILCEFLAKSFSNPPRLPPEQRFVWKVDGLRLNPSAQPLVAHSKQQVSTSVPSPLPPSQPSRPRADPPKASGGSAAIPPGAGTSLPAPPAVQPPPSSLVAGLGNRTRKMTQSGPSKRANERDKAVFREESPLETGGVDLGAVRSSSESGSASDHGFMASAHAQPVNHPYRTLVLGHPDFMQDPSKNNINPTYSVEKFVARLGAARGLLRGWNSVSTLPNLAAGPGTLSLLLPSPAKSACAIWQMVESMGLEVQDATTISHVDYTADVQDEGLVAWTIHDILDLSRPMPLMASSQAISDVNPAILSSRILDLLVQVGQDYLMRLCRSSSDRRSKRHTTAFIHVRIITYIEALIRRSEANKSTGEMEKYSKYINKAVRVMATSCMQDYFSLVVEHVVGLWAENAKVGRIYDRLKHILASFIQLNADALWRYTNEDPAAIDPFSMDVLGHLGGGAEILMKNILESPVWWNTSNDPVPYQLSVSTSVDTHEPAFIYAVELATSHWSTMSCLERCIFFTLFFFTGCSGEKWASNGRYQQFLRKLKALQESMQNAARDLPCEGSAALIPEQLAQTSSKVAPTTLTEASQKSAAPPPVEPPPASEPAQSGHCVTLTSDDTQVSKTVLSDNLTASSSDPSLVQAASSLTMTETQQETIANTNLALLSPDKPSTSTVPVAPELPASQQLTLEGGQDVPTRKSTRKRKELPSTAEEPNSVAQSERQIAVQASGKRRRNMIVGDEGPSSRMDEPPTNAHLVEGAESTPTTASRPRRQAAIRSLEKTGELSRARRT